MRESIGATYIFSLCITFIMLFTAYLAVSVNYSKAFRIKSNIISMIEENNGLGGSLPQDIREYVISQAYTASGTCPVASTFTDNNSDTVGTAWRVAPTGHITAYSGIAGENVCLYELELPANDTDAIDDIDATKRYYKVVTFFKFDLPIIGGLTTFKISGDTKLLYE